MDNGISLAMIIAFMCVIIGFSALGSGLTGTLGEIVNENGKPIFRNILITTGSILLLIGGVIFLWGLLTSRQFSSYLFDNIN